MRFIRVFLLLWCWGLFLLPAAAGADRRFPDPLYDICLKGTRGIAVGYYGTILLSEDGGTKWAPVSSGTKELLVSLSFPDAEHGWVVGSNGTILATRDGGRTWKPQVSSTSNYLSGVCFVNPQKGWVVGEAGTILYTEDGGAHWQAQQSGETEAMLEGVRFLDEKRGFVVGEFGIIMVTEDGGATWKYIIKREENILDIEAMGKNRPTLYSLYFDDDKTGVAVGVGGCILRTQDGGKTWQNIPSPTANHIYRVKSHDGRMWATGLQGTLLKSEDNGQSWNLTYLPMKISLNWYYGITGNSQALLLAGETGEVVRVQLNRVCPS
jgi:photosystem II stability/assembly factor-like uncharacterized protein